MGIQMFNGLVIEQRYDIFRYRRGCMAKVLIEGFRCERCEYEWVPREKGVEPMVCPSCKSPYWNKPRQKKKAKK